MYKIEAESEETDALKLKYQRAYTPIIIQLSDHWLLSIIAHPKCSGWTRTTPLRDWRWVEYLFIPDCLHRSYMPYFHAPQQSNPLNRRSSIDKEGPASKPLIITAGVLGVLVSLMAILCLVFEQARRQRIKENVERTISGATDTMSNRAVGLHKELSSSHTGCADTIAFALCRSHMWHSVFAHNPLFNCLFMNIYLTFAWWLNMARSCMLQSRFDAIPWVVSHQHSPHDSSTRRIPRVTNSDMFCTRMWKMLQVRIGA